MKDNDQSINWSQNNTAAGRDCGLKVQRSLTTSSVWRRFANWKYEDTSRTDLLRYDSSLRTNTTVDSVAPLTQLELPLAGPQVLQDLVVVLLEGVDVGVQERRRVLVAFLLPLQLIQPPFQELHLGLQGGQARHLFLKEGGEKGRRRVTLFAEVGQKGV